LIQAASPAHRHRQIVATYERSPAKLSLAASLKGEDKSVTHNKKPPLITGPIGSTAAIALVLAITFGISGCKKNDGSISRNLQYFGVNGFQFGNMLEISLLTPADSPILGYNYSFQEGSFSVDPSYGILREMYVPIGEEGATISLDADGSTEEPAWYAIEDVTAFFGKGKTGWQDEALGLRYVEYTYAITKLSATIRFVYVDNTGSLSWIQGESSLPFAVPLASLAS
jgi:hypothetical protein